MELKESYGAYANLFIRFEKNIHELVRKLEKGLELKELRIENQEYEPYNPIAYSEVLGFEMEVVELKENQEWPGYNYLMAVVTSDSLKEIVNKHMHDLSLWMARYVTVACGITTLVSEANKEIGQSFYRNEKTMKVEINLVGRENSVFSGKSHPTQNFINKIIRKYIRY